MAIIQLLFKLGPSHIVNSIFFICVKIIEAINIETKTITVIQADIIEILLTQFTYTFNHYSL